MSRQRRTWSLLFAPALLAICSSACSSTDSGSEGSAAGTSSAGANAAAGSSSAGANAAAGSSSAGANAAAGATSGGDSEPASVQGITAAHNAARAAVTPSATPAIPPLVWSGEVAAAAKAWAEGCNFKHSGGKYGENIYASAGKDATAADVLGSWAGEAKDYDYATNTCKGVCGHYTQVVWRKSARLGCALAKCSKNSPFSGFPEWQFVVCNYDPPGNFNNQKPY